MGHFHSPVCTLHMYKKAQINTTKHTKKANIWMYERNSYDVAPGSNAAR